MHTLLLKAFLETLHLIFLSGIIGILIGFLLSLCLYLLSYSSKNMEKWLYNFLSTFLDVFRGIPFIILIVLISPFTRSIIGASIGTKAAIVPLSIAVVPFAARLFENNLRAIPQGFQELGAALGGTHCKTLVHIILPQALPQIISSCCLVMVDLVSYSTMAGIIGGGGLGDLGVRYGYHRYCLDVMIQVTILLISLVWIFQRINNLCNKHYQKLNK